jgi:chromosome segregation ATPase
MSTANIDIFVQKHGSDQALKDVEKGLADTQTRANALGSEVDKAGVTFKEMAERARALGVSLRSDLEAKLHLAETSLQMFREQGQLTNEQERKLQDTITGLKAELAGLTKETGSAEKSQQSLVTQIAGGVIAAGLFQKAGRAVVDFMRDSIDEAAKYELAQRNLNVAY